MDPTRFASITIDISRASDTHAPIFSLNTTDPAWLKAAQALAPAILRVGGTAEDATSYINFDNCEAGLHNVPQNLSCSQFQGLLDFATRVGWDVVFGLNSVEPLAKGDAPNFNLDMLQSLASYARRRADSGKPSLVGYELGNEPTLTNLPNKNWTAAMLAAEYEQAFAALAKTYKTRGDGTPSAPWFMGPDATPLAFDHKTFLRDFLGNLTQLQVWLDVLTYHFYYPRQGGEVPDTYVTPAVLDAFLNTTKKVVALHDTYVKAAQRVGAPVSKLVLGETGNPLRANSSGQIPDVFATAIATIDKLALAAAQGHAWVNRQQFSLLIGSVSADTAPQPTPGFYALQAWRTAVGGRALNVTHMLNPWRHFRAYAMCGKRDSDVTLILINLNRSASATVGVTQQAALLGQELELEGANPFGEATRADYVLTSWPSINNASSIEIALNGQRLAPDSDGSIPHMEPSKAAKGKSLVLPPLTITFAVFENVNAKACQAGGSE